MFPPAGNQLFQQLHQATPSEKTSRRESGHKNRNMQAYATIDHQGPARESMLPDIELAVKQPPIQYDARDLQREHAATKARLNSSTDKPSDPGSMRYDRRNSRSALHDSQM